MNSNSLNGHSHFQNSINFFAKIRDKKSEGIVNELYKFINVTFQGYSQINDKSTISTAVQDFISEMINEFAKVWEVEFTNNGNAYKEICDGFEALIMKSLYSQILVSLGSGDEKKMEKLFRKYSFVSLKHLKIEQFVDEFELASQLKCKIL
jgi:hypothetical protein